MDITKDTVTGFLSGLIRSIISGAAGWLAATHPAIAGMFGPAINPVVIQIAAAFLAAVIVALVGAWLRQLRHNKLFDAAFQAGVSAATNNPADVPSPAPIPQANAAATRMPNSAPSFTAAPVWPSGNAGRICAFTRFLPIWFFSTI